MLSSGSLNGPYMVLPAVSWKDGIFLGDRKSTRLNPSHVRISYAVFCLKKEEHTSEVQSRPHLVCRLLLEKKTNNVKNAMTRAVLSRVAATLSSNIYALLKE